MSEENGTELFYVREFLNKPGYESIGLILGGVKMNEWKRKDGSLDRELSADLTIGDCSRQITLDFCLYGRNDDEKKENIKHKAALLRRVVNEFCDALDVCLDEF